MKAVVSCIAVLVGTLGVTAWAAQDWPRFRGPAGSGVADSQPLRTAWDGIKGEGVTVENCVARGRPLEPGRLGQSRVPDDGD